MPEEIRIYETYNPGAVVQIWAYTIEGEWECLWQRKAKYTFDRARCFTPELKRIRDPTR